MNSAGAGAYSASFNACSITQPGVPTGLTANIYYVNHLYLTWNHPPSAGGLPITSYVVQYKSEFGTWTTVNDSSPNDTSTRVDQALPGYGCYDFRVAAKNASGIGAFTNPLHRCYVATPGAPTGLQVAAVIGGFRLTWNAPAATNGAPITGYVIQSNTTGTWTTVTPSGSLAPRSADISSFERCAEFRVAAVNAAAVGAYGAAVRSCH